MADAMRTLCWLLYAQAFPTGVAKAFSFRMLKATTAKRTKSAILDNIEYEIGITYLHRAQIR